MGYAQIRAVGLVGVGGRTVTVEANLSPGLPTTVITGLPDAALAAARDRVRAAVANSGESWPNTRVTVNLLPASQPKHGSGFDLAIAVAVLAADGRVPAGRLGGTVLVGELGLDGRVRPVRGVLPAVVAAARAGLTRVVVPVANAREASLVPGVRVRAVDHLRRLVDFACGDGDLLAPPAEPPLPVEVGPDLADLVGQPAARRALETAAAGGHHLAMFGPPGAGKTMLAERLPSILPPLGDDAAMEVTAVHSIAGVLPVDAPLVRRPPYQAPHHTASTVALVGGGSGVPRPGAISLAHQGVLFLDEAPEFSSRTLEALRQPLETGHVRLARAYGSAVYPSRVQLVIAGNPCPCANPAGDQLCDCTPLARRRYLGRLSGPLLDRIDLQITLLPVRSAELLADTSLTEPSTVVAARVRAARATAAARWSTVDATPADTPEDSYPTPVDTIESWRATHPTLAGPMDRWRGSDRTNAQVPGAVLRARPWRLPRTVTRIADDALDSGRLSTRGYDRLLRISWTIADLSGRDRPGADELAEAYDLRMRRN